MFSGRIDSDEISLGGVLEYGLFSSYCDILVTFTHSFSSECSTVIYDSIDAAINYYEILPSLFYQVSL